ncbi:hypothetical protein T09_10313 [Trichinella sp. T9]|nr:hypothetical protein T09_10313 [Trichinella sp. T9]
MVRMNRAPDGATSVLTSIVGIKFHIQYFVCCCAKSISLPERDQPPPFSLDLPAKAKMDK